MGLEIYIQVKINYIVENLEKITAEEVEIRKQRKLQVPNQELQYNTQLEILEKICEGFKF